MTLADHFKSILIPLGIFLLGIPGAPISIPILALFIRGLRETRPGSGALGVCILTWMFFGLVGWMVLAIYSLACWVR